ncbi:MAG: hypothetical protein FWE14_07565 [Lachnospiraceae bacterium]|nr:hypothetical protein [Lachnospiraceae bacterium]
MKKIIALLLVTILSVTTLSACGIGKKNEPVTLTVYSQLANYNGEMIGWFAQVMLEKFNVKMILIGDGDGIYETRMEAGDLGDIVVWGNDGEQYINAIKQGLLFDWDDDNLLADYGPYILEHMPAALQKNRGISERETGAGTLYGFGNNVAVNSLNHEDFFYSWDLRWDLYRDLGYPSMRNLAEFADVLEMMRDINPYDVNDNPVYAASMWPDWDGNMVMYVVSTATAYYGYEGFHLGLYDPESGDFYPTLMEGGPYLTILEWYNDLFRRGLIDPDSMTQVYPTMFAKVQNGGTLFSIFDYSGSMGFNSPENIEQDKIMLSYAPDEASPLTYGMNIYGSNRIWSIGAKTQYPELCMEILNWFATPEGRLTIDYGPKGITWDYDEDGYTYFTELGKLTNTDRNTEMFNGYSGKFGDGAFQINNLTWSAMAENPDSNGDLYNKDFWKMNQKEPRNAAEADWREFTGAYSSYNYLTSRKFSVSPSTSYSEGVRNAELRSTWEQVTKAIRDYSWRAIYAPTKEEYQKIVDELIIVANEYGYDDCINWSLNEVTIRKALEAEVRAAQ